MKKYNILWLAFFGVIGLYADQNSQKKLLYQQLNAQATIMTNLIKRYQKIRSLNIEEQKEFINNLYSFLIEEQSLQAAGEDQLVVHDIAEQYSAIYLAWTKIMITDPNLAQEIDNLHKVVLYPNSVNDAAQEKSVALYTKLISLIQLYQSDFDSAINQALDNAGQYSTSNKKSFTDALDRAYFNFNKSTIAAHTAVKGEYILSLSDPTDLTLQDHRVLQIMDNLVQDAQLMVRAFLIDLTSAQVKMKTLKDLEDSFAISHNQLMDAYQKELYNNEQNLSENWWKQVQASGKALAAEFAQQFKLEIVKQGKLLLMKQVAEIGKQSTVYVSNTLTDTTNNSLEVMSETLKTESWLDFQNASSMAQKIVAQSIQATVPVSAPVSPVKVNKNYALISADEKKFKATRFKNYVQPALQKLGIEQPLNVAFCCSGGGVRAMLGTIGVLSAAAQQGILQATMYLAGVSGATWAIAPWAYLYSFGKLGADYSKSFEMMQQNLVQGLNPENMYRVSSTGMYMPGALKAPFAQYFAHQVATRVAYQQNLSLVDLFGALVSNFALDLAGDHKLNARWSAMAPWLMSIGSVPLPLGTAVYDAKKRSSAASSAVTNYAWVELNPFEVSVEGAGKIPWKYFGSQFLKGSLSKSDGMVCPEYPISYLLGLCASLFALRPDDLPNQDLPSPQFNVFGHDVLIPTNQWIAAIIKESVGVNNEERRNKYLAAVVPNFSQAVAGSTVIRQPDLALLDAGLACNFPLPVLLNKKDRTLDVIFIYDSHAGDANAFRQANDYITQRKLNAPSLAGVSSKVLTADKLVVFNDPRSTSYKATQPTLIYIPTMVDSAGLPYTTFNFGYTAEQVNTLVDTVAKKFNDHSDDIKSIMKLVAQKRVVNTTR